MSRDKRLKDRPIIPGNCVTNERINSSTVINKAKIEHDEWEEKQVFVIERLNHKTTVYRRIKKGEKVNKQLIHKGKI